MLVYDVMLNGGKKVRFLAFPAYTDKLQNLAEKFYPVNYQHKRVKKKISRNTQSEIHIISGYYN
jgi:hypothetical protein